MTRRMPPVLRSAAAGTLFLLTPAGGAAQQSGTLPPDGAELYRAGCASCHGSDGTGAAQERIAFEDPLPDFSDCSFASREPDADWIAVAHAGGPVRGFSETMPAFGEAFDRAQLQAIIDHIRTFCDDPAWPAGELNLPRPLITEKAYPEDELVWTTGLDTDSDHFRTVVTELVYEKRFGPRSQIEIVVPFGWYETPALDETGRVVPGDWDSSLGSVALALKHAVVHGARSILSLTGEVKLPTSPARSQLNDDALRFEPFATLGQVLGESAFLHAQAGLDIPVSSRVAGLPTELFWRGVLGTTLTSGEFGRSWSPMVELLWSYEVAGTQPLDDPPDVMMEVAPQIQVTLNTRQHVMLNLGARIPVTHTDERGPRLMVYLLWDWFDGGLFDGW